MSLSRHRPTTPVTTTKNRNNSNPDEYPSLVLDFGLNHTSKATGTYVNEAAATKHKELQDASKSSQESGENVPEKEVMKKVLDKTLVVGKEDEEYEESDDKEMEVLDEHEEINDGHDSVE
uniref:Uncharacterized protein n=1 Tax=Tanacetum cinerariifolium TaxID=118510 RepID=A0A699I5H8_TANCI|nr:hypothetical protein [Tanacetum cinerariifolium]